ncbi:MAG: glycine-rich domain-containing protein [bacterium]
MSVTTNGGTAATGYLFYGLTNPGTNLTWSFTNELGTLPSAGTVTNTLTNLTPVTTYYFMYYATNVGLETAWGGSTGVAFTTIGLPSVTTLPATNVFSFGACMNGMLVTNGVSAATVRLYWGTNDGQAVATDWQFTNEFPNAFGSGCTLTTNITTLAPGTRYYYRYYATNSIAEAWAATTENFRTAYGHGRMSAIGGDATNLFDGSRIHIFTNIGSSTFTVAMGGTADVLIVAGGGGGAGIASYAGSSAGGGAGGYIYTNMFLTGGTYQVTVGAGGAGGAQASQSESGFGKSGSNSVFSALTAFGGGGGGNARNGVGRNGGSGGGGAYSDSNPPIAGGAATNGQGYAGGSGGVSWPYGAGGGGGAAGLGGSGHGGAGGAGISNSISGVGLFYAGGGGGGCEQAAGGIGGSGVGGNGGRNSSGGTGTAGRGGGGGGAGGGGSGGVGGSGGSGAVIVRYVLPPPEYPSVEGAPATNVLLTSACFNGRLVTNGASSAEVRLYWGLTDGLDQASGWRYTNYFTGTFPDGAAFTTNLVGLATTTRYYYRYCASNSYGVGWSAAISFSTFGPPAVSSLAATNVQKTSAWLNGSLDNTGGTSTTVRVYWGTNDPGPVYSDWLGTNDLGSTVVAGVRTCLAGPLLPGRTYYYRYYATNTFGETWSVVTNFQTVGTPDVTTLGATNILNTSAWLNGTMVSNGGAPATVVVYWATNDLYPSYTGWLGTNAFAPDTEGPRTWKADGLVVDTVYYYRYYATNAFGETWGGVANFRTYGPPVVSTVAPTNVHATSAWLNGNLSTTGSVPTTVRVYLATSDLGQVYDGWLATNDFGIGGVGARSWQAAGLVSGQTYWYRYYATNYWGESWGSPLSFTPIAADGTWTSVVSGVWSDTNRWLSGQVADGSNRTATFMADLTGATTVTLDATRTVGHLRSEDAVTPSHDWTIAAASPNMLILSTTTGPSTVDVSNRTLTISAPVTGAARMDKIGAGELALSYNGNTFGGVTLSSGILRVNAAGALGTGTLDIAAGTPQIWTTAGGGVTVNGNPSRWGVSFQANGTTAAGATALNLGTGAVTVASSITLTTVETGSTFTAGGPVDLGANTLTVNAGSGVALSGKITGTGGLAKSGTNVLTLSSTTSDFTGGIAIWTGTVAFASNSLGNGGSVAFAGTSTLQWASGNVQDISGRLVISNGVTAMLDTGANNVSLASSFGASGSGAVTKLGSGALTLAAANTYGGLTTVGAGRLAFGINDALAGGDLLVAGGTLDIGAYSDSVGLVSLTSGSIIGTSGVLTSTTGFAISNATAATISAKLAGTVGLTKSGAGALTLSNTNSYTGGTTIGASAGGISFARDGLGTSGAITFAGNAPIQWAAGNTQDISGRLVINAGVTATLDTGANNVTLASAFGAGGTGSLTKTGAGILTIGGTNTYSGLTTASNGTLRIAGIQTAGSEYSIGASGTLDIGAAGVAGASLTVSRLTLAGANSGLVLEFNTAPTNDTASVATSDGLTINGGKIYLRTEGGADWATNGTYNLIQYSGAIKGGGLATLAIGNPVGGKSYFFSASGGWLMVTIGTGLTKTWDGGGADDYWNSGTNWSDNLAPSALDSLTFAGSVRLTPQNNLAGGTRFNSITFSGASAFVLGGNTVNLVGGVVNNSSATGGQRINLNLNLDAGGRLINTAAGGPVTIAGNIGEVGGSWGITKIGSGFTLILAGTNTYTGATVINEGTLQLGRAGTLSDATSVEIATAGTLDLAGFSETVDGLSGTGNARVINSAGSAVTLTIGGNGGSGSWGGQIIGAGITLTKDGGGTQVITGTNAPSGGIWIRNGSVTGAGVSSLGSNVVVQGGAATALRLEVSSSFAAGGILTIMPDSGKVYLAAGTTNIVGRLYFGAVSQARGTWGATGSGADFIDDTHFAGTGVLQLGSSSSMTWDAGDADSDSWSASMNWVGDVGPANPTAGTLTFANKGKLDVNGNIDIGNTNIVDADWQIGGLTYANNYGRHTTELAGHALTVLGSVLANVANSGASSADGWFRNGAVRIGSEASRVSLNIAIGNASGRLGMSGGSFAGILSSLSVGVGGIHYGAVPSGDWGTLDLSAVDGGTLDVGSLQVGYGGYGKGVVSLGSNWTIKVGSPSARGTFDVGRNVNKMSLLQDGTVTAARGGGSLTVYASTMRIGCSGWGPEGAAYTAKGTVLLGGITGPVVIDAQSLEIGSCQDPTDTATFAGVLDLGGTTNLTLNAGTLVVGHGGPGHSDGDYGGTGRLLLGSGTGTVGTASIGGPHRFLWLQLLDTHGTLMTFGTKLQITNSFAIDYYGAVTNFIGSRPAGLDITSASDSALTINAASLIDIGHGLKMVFTSDPPVTVACAAGPEYATGVHWGLRWKGDKTSLLIALRNGANEVPGDGDDRLRWDDSALGSGFAGQVGIFYDAGLGTEERPFDMTYVGFYTRPRPNLTILNGLAPFGGDISSTQAVVTAGMFTNGGSAATGYVLFDTVNRGTNRTWGFTNSLGIMASGTTVTNTITNLLPNTQYYFMAYATNLAGDEAWGGVTGVAFTTAGLPVISTVAATNISAAAARLDGLLVDEGGVSTTVRVYWDTVDRYPATNGWVGSHDFGVGAAGARSWQAMGLSGGRTYVCRYYATNARGEGWGSPVSFTTMTDLTIVNGGAPTGRNVTAWDAVASANLVTDGGAVATCFLFYGTNNPGTNLTWSFTNQLGVLRSRSTVESFISGLYPNTTYYLMAYSTNTDGQAAWGGVTGVMFRTIGAPILASLAATNVANTSAWLNGSLVTNGVAPATVWAYWDTADRYPATTGWMGTNSFGEGVEGARTCQATGLAVYTTYVVRFYATNLYGYGWSSATNFRTLGAPTISALAASNITDRSAWLNGNLVTNGAAPATVRVFWGLTDLYPSTVGWLGTNDLGSGVEGARTSQATGLASNTTYVYRYYATNAYDAAWSAVTNFTTFGPPTVQTLAATNVQSTGAWLNGNLVSSNGAPTTVRVYFGATDVGPVPTGWQWTNDFGVVGTGVRTCPATNLTLGQTYWYRYNATSSYGECWGDATSFVPGYGASLTWDGEDLTDNWSAGTNWSANETPANPTDGTLTFGNAGVGGTNIVDTDWQVRGLSYASGSGEHITELAGHTLTVAGTLGVGSSSGRGYATLRGGNVRIGTATTRGNLSVSASGGSTQTLTQASGTFTGLLNNLSIIGSGDYSVATTDVSAVNGGTLDVANSFVVGEASGRSCGGWLSLGSNWTVRIGSSSAARGVIRVGSATDEFGTRGDVRCLAGGGSLTAYVSSFYVGYITGDKYGGGYGTVDLSGITGPVVIDTPVMGIGLVNPRYLALGTGYLNLSGTRSLSMNVGQLTVGNGGLANSGPYRATGRLLLGAGTCTVATASIGGPYLTLYGSVVDDTGLLATYGTTVRVTNTLSMDLYGCVSNNIAGTSSGLDFTTDDDWALWIQSTMLTGGALRVVFTLPPTGNVWNANSFDATGVHWGLRWKGDHVSRLLSLLGGADGVQGNNDDKLRWEDSAVGEALAGQVNVFHDPGLGTADRPYDMTYVGCYTRELTGTGSPAILTWPATNVMATSAHMNGYLVSTGGVSTVVRVYWSSSGDQGLTYTGWDGTNEWTGVETGAMSYAASGLTSNGTYTYRFYAVNSAGENWGMPKTFTLASLPTVVTMPVTNIQPTSAVLKGNLTAGGTARVRVLWGTADAGPSLDGWQATNDLGEVGLGVKASPVTGLTPGQIYYYRFHATNCVGESWGEAVAFWPGAVASVTWDGEAGEDDNWSTGLNWVGDVVPASPQPSGWIYFVTNDSGNVNVVDRDWEVNGVNYTTNHTTRLAGHTLTLKSALQININGGLGTVWLDGGVIKSAGQLNDSYGYLVASQVVFQVSNSVYIGTTGSMTSIVAGASSGIDLANTNDWALSIQSTSGSGRGLNFIFTRSIDPPSMDPYWGLRWAGNHTNALMTLVKGVDGIEGTADDKLRWDDSAMDRGVAGRVRIFYDKGKGTAARPFNTTYIGTFVETPDGTSFIVW